MKTRYYLLILLSGIALSLFSQRTVEYTYDNDGNMESRSTFTLRSAKINEPENELIDEVELENEKIFSVALGNKQITIYPNPTQGEICVEITSLNLGDENYMHLFDSSGRLIETKRIESERTYLIISGNPGVYLLNIHLGINTSKWKIVKQ